MDEIDMSRGWHFENRNYWTVKKDDEWRQMTKDELQDWYDMVKSSMGIDIQPHLDDLDFLMQLHYGKAIKLFREKYDVTPSIIQVEEIVDKDGNIWL